MLVTRIGLEIVGRGIRLAVVQLHFVKFSPKLEKLAINKPFECRSAVVRSPSFRPMREGYYVVVRAVLLCGKGENRWCGIGGSMATVDITDVRPNGNSFAEGRLNPPDEVWAPPLAPNGTTAAGHDLLREETFRPVIGGEDSFQPLEPNNLYETNPSETFGARRKLIAGTAIIAALGVAGLTYFFLASPGAKVPAETTESSPIAAQSSSETPVQPAPTVPEPSRGASGVVPPASLAIEASPQVAPSAVTPQTTSAAQNLDFVFLQRPGVNIRSAPSGNAPVLGSAPKGTRFTATSREGDWVQVENTGLKGWINSQFLAPNKPQ